MKGLSIRMYMRSICSMELCTYACVYSVHVARNIVLCTLCITNLTDILNCLSLHLCMYVLTHVHLNGGPTPPCTPVEALPHPVLQRRHYPTLYSNGGPTPPCTPMAALPHPVLQWRPYPTLYSNGGPTPPCTPMEALPHPVLQWRPYPTLYCTPLTSCPCRSLTRWNSHLIMTSARSTASFLCSIVACTTQTHWTKQDGTCYTVYCCCRRCCCCHLTHIGDESQSLYGRDHVLH